MNVEEYVNKLDSPFREIVSELRKIITSHSASIKEEMKWNVPTYSVNRNVCSIIAHKQHVNFQLFNGAHIQGERHLSGTGKDMRHLKISAVDEIEKNQLKMYLTQAMALDK